MQWWRWGWGGVGMLFWKHGGNKKTNYLKELYTFLKIEYQHIKIGFTKVKTLFLGEHILKDHTYNILFNDTLNIFFIYGYMASDIW